MERKFLKDELGLSDDVVTKIMAENGKDVDRVEEKLTAVTSERDSLQSQVGERDDQLKQLKKESGDNQELKDKITQLESDNKETAQKYQDELQQTKMESAINLVLKDAKARDTKAILPFLDKDVMKLADDGSVSGLKEQVDKLKKEKDFLFEEVKPAEPDDSHINAFAGGNPSGTPGDGEDSIISKIAGRLGK